jgi:carbohydrate-selective porin OprB
MLTLAAGASALGLAFRAHAAPAFDWLTVRPNLQYIRHPGGVDKVDDALIGGIKIQSSF